MRYFAVLFTLIFTINCFSLSLELKDNVIIKGTNVYLKNIAKVLKDENNRWNSIKYQKVGNISLSLNKTVIPLPRLINLSKDLNCTFTNLKAVTIRRNVKKVDEKQLRKLIEKFLKEKNRFVELVSYHIPENLYISENSKIVVDRASSNTLCGNFPITLTVLDTSTNKRFKYINLRVTTKVKMKVAIADYQLKRGDKISLSNVHFQVKEFNTLRRTPITLEQAKNIRAKSTINPGQIIFENSVEEIPIINKNELVSVIVKDEGFVMELKGIAKENGTFGKVIRVYNPDSRKIIKAKVIGNNKAEVL